MKRLKLWKLQFKTIVAIKNKDLLFFNSGISVNSECFRFIRNVRECFEDMGNFPFYSFDDFSTYLQSSSLEKQQDPRKIMISNQNHPSLSLFTAPKASSCGCIVF